MRLRAYLETVGQELGIADLPSGGLFLDMLIDVQIPSRLLRMCDLENYLTPLAIHLGWRRFVLARAVKRVGGGSSITVGRALPAASDIAEFSGALTVEAGSGPDTKGWKQRLRQQFLEAGVKQLPDGPVEVELSFKSSESRNWVMLWKPAGDSMGPVLGEPDARNPFNVADDRIVALSHHRDIDGSIGHGIQIGVWWRPARNPADHTV